MSRVAILQPSFLPWLGYLDQIDQVDDFVFYDDVQFDKHGWRNRNRIKTSNGVNWLTVPVRHKGRFGQTNADVEIDVHQPWSRKHVLTMRQAYARAPFVEQYLPKIEEILGAASESLVDLNLALIRQFMEWLGISTRLHLSSDIGQAGDKVQRLIAICHKFHATDYLSGAAGASYVNVDTFLEQGIRVHFHEFSHPIYPQLHGPFVPYLSILDLLMNCGPQSVEVLRQGRREMIT